MQAFFFLFFFFPREVEKNKWFVHMIWSSLIYDIAISANYTHVSSTVVASSAVNLITIDRERKKNTLVWVAFICFQAELGRYKLRCLISAVTLVGIMRKEILYEQVIGGTYLPLVPIKGTYAATKPDISLAEDHLKRNIKNPSRSQLDAAWYLNTNRESKISAFDPSACHEKPISTSRFVALINDRSSSGEIIASFTSCFFF